MGGYARTSSEFQLHQSTSTSKQTGRLRIPGARDQSQPPVAVPQHKALLFLPNRMSLPPQLAPHHPCESEPRSSHGPASRAHDGHGVLPGSTQGPHRRAHCLPTAPRRPRRAVRSGSTNQDLSPELKLVAKIRTLFSPRICFADSNTSQLFLVERISVETVCSAGRHRFCASLRAGWRAAGAQVQGATSRGLGFLAPHRNGARHSPLALPPAGC